MFANMIFNKQIKNVTIDDRGLSSINITFETVAQMLLTQK